MPTDDQRMFWLIMGGLAGALLTGLVAVLLLAVISIDFLANWQTLIAGVLALGGAGITVFAILRQIDEQRRIEHERRFRRLMAARAALPAALSSMVEYSDDGIRFLSAINEARDKERDGERIILRHSWQGQPLPALSSEALTTLRLCIESADDPERRALVDVLKEHQVLAARLRAFLQDASPGSSSVIGRHSYLCRVVDCLEFQVRCEELFQYARGGDWITPLQDYSRVENRVYFLNVDLDGIEKLFSERRRGESLSE